MATKKQAQAPTAEAPEANGKKTTCPVTREQFRKSAKPLVLELAGQKIILSPKEFSTDSLGWFTNDKFVVEVDGVPCKVQPSFSLVLVGSKELPK